MRIALVVMLVGAVIVGTQAREGFVEGWVVPLIFGIGAFNALVVVPGTSGIRLAAIIGAFVGLFFPSSRGMVLFLFWLLWPPAFLLAWAVEDSDTDDENGTRAARDADVLSPARLRGAAAVAAVAVGSIAYKVIFQQQLNQTAALFVGIPALLAIVVVMFVTPQSAAGVACKAVTVGLLVSLLFLGEGILCVVMAAPIFYGVAVGMAAAVDAQRRRKARTLYSHALVLLVFISSLEGVSPSLSFDREESVAVTRTVRASAAEIQRAILDRPRFDRVMPLELRAGFPRPTAVRIDEGAGRWIIRMRGGEMRIDGLEPRAGDLVLQLEASQPGLVRWRALSDNSHMPHFLAWRAATVEWQAIGPQTTRVTWTLAYDRGLDPAWYFGPWERYIAGIAAGYLIDSVATP